MRLSIATHPTQEEVDKVAESLAPDVVRIRMLITENWEGEPAVYFRTTLSDDASGVTRLSEVVRRVRETLHLVLDLQDSELFPYFRFRSVGEMKRLEDSRWG